ncbi:hypothetical protein VNO77_43092 [Canavalia gladiata]|uniref:Uncharacterized protein n=1 Tax=Canavalia gladiata TaxID=3824 RepID=A0AAN9JW74_CANGL
MKCSLPDVHVRFRRKLKIKLVLVDMFFNINTSIIIFTSTELKNLNEVLKNERHDRTNHWSKKGIKAQKIATTRKQNNKTRISFKALLNSPLCQAIFSASSTPIRRGTCEQMSVGPETVINARVMGNSFKVGVQVQRSHEDGWFTKECVCKAVKTVMDCDNEIGKEVRANHAKFRETWSPLIFTLSASKYNKLWAVSSYGKEPIELRCKLTQVTLGYK